MILASIFKLFIVADALYFVQSDIFNVDPKVFEGKPECVRLNQTLYSYIDKILAKLNETIESNHRDSEAINNHDLGAHTSRRKPASNHNDRKVETIRKFYNFTIIPPAHPSKPLHFYGFFNLNSTDTFKTSPLFDFLVGENPIVKFLPTNYQIQVITIEGSEFPFTFITGKRCKWVCDRRSRDCDDAICWENPSFCQGSHEDCLKLDGNGTCFDIPSFGFPEEYFEKSLKSNGTHKVLTTIDIGKYAQYHGEDNLFISDDGRAQDILKFGFHWVCNEVSEGSENIICETDWMHVGVTTKLLKTIAG